MATENVHDDETYETTSRHDDESLGSLSMPPEGRIAQEGPAQNALSSSLQNLWSLYRCHVRRHQITLHLLDDLLTRIIFWTPHSSHDLSQMTRWREVMYGLISLHRLAMDLAVTHDQVIGTYGATLQLTEAPVVPATALRIALTVSHNLMPTVLELARSHPQRQATCRLWLERVKFSIRMILLTSYWKQVRDEACAVVGGLLQDGGMYRAGYDGMQLSVPTIANVQALKYRREYVGRRTGRRVMSGEGSIEERKNRLMWLRLILGELLRLYRPLYWAQAERDVVKSCSTQQLWKAWVLSLVMEVTSLQCLSGAVSRDNPQSQAELSRRRMKVLLYLLRSPAWDTTIEPRILQTTALLRRVPLLGRFIETYLWEWLLYWKHPFVSEEE